MIISRLNKQVINNIIPKTLQAFAKKKYKKVYYRFVRVAMPHTSSYNIHNVIL